MGVLCKNVKNLQNFSRLLIKSGTIARLGSKFVKEILEMAEGVNAS